MTKPRTKRLLLAGLLALLIPVSVSAQSVSEREAEFCGRQAERRQAVDRGFSARSASYDEAVRSQSENQAARRNRLDEGLARSRAQADITRRESYRLIREKQQSDEDRALAGTYAEEVDAAITARRAAYDQARAAFRQTVDNLLAGRDHDIRAAAAAFQASADTAMQSAAAQCTSARSDRAAARWQFINDLQSARLSYADRLRARQDFRTDAGEAVKVRNQAFRQATAEFQRAMQAVRAKYSALAPNTQ